jgi:hypothetical protein
MLLTSVKILGTWDDDDVLVNISINSLCDKETVDKLCELLRDNANKFGGGLNLSVTSISEDF